MAYAFSGIKATLWQLIIAYLILLPRAIASPQSDAGETDDIAESPELAQVAKDSKLPAESVASCAKCDSFTLVILACRDDDAYCMCGGNDPAGPNQYQSCAQCLVDLGPKTAGLSEEDLDTLMSRYSAGCIKAGYPNNVTAHVSPTPGSPTAKKNHGTALLIQSRYLATATLIATALLATT